MESKAFDGKEHELGGSKRGTVNTCPCGTFPSKAMTNGYQYRYNTLAGYRNYNLRYWYG